MLADDLQIICFSGPMRIKLTFVLKFIWQVQQKSLEKFRVLSFTINDFLVDCTRNCGNFIYLIISQLLSSLADQFEDYLIFNERRWKRE